jgi:hypothetical protein
MHSKAPVGYSGKYRKIVPLPPLLKGQTQENVRSLSPIKKKFQNLPNDLKKIMPVSPSKNLFKKVSLIKLIEEKANDYESAIKDHLGIKNLSRDSSRSVLNKYKSLSRSKKPVKSMDLNQSKDLAAIEEQEHKLTNSIKNLDRRKKTSKSKIVNNIKQTDKEDREIKSIQDSLKKINLLLKKILNKNPKKHK